MIESRMNEEQVSPMRYLLFLFVFMNVCGVSCRTGKMFFAPVPMRIRLKKSFSLTRPIAQHIINLRYGRL